MYMYVIEASRSEPHINHSYKKIAVLIYVFMYVCMYVRMYVCMYIPICHPHAQHACACAQIDTVRIISIDRMLTLNVAHQTTDARAF